MIFPHNCLGWFFFSHWGKTWLMFVNARHELLSTQWPCALSLYISSLFWSGLNPQWNRTVPTLLALLYTKHCSVPQTCPPPSSTHPSPTVPLLSPFSCDPSDLCSVTAQWKHPMLRLPWRWPWRAPVRHTHTRLHTAAKASDRYSIIRRVARRERGRVALQWAHCRGTRGKLERGWVCECVCQREWQRVGVHVSSCVYVWVGDTAFVIGQWVSNATKFFCVSYSRGLVHFPLDAAKWPRTIANTSVKLQSSMLFIIYLICVVVGQ